MPQLTEAQLEELLCDISLADAIKEGRRRVRVKNIKARKVVAATVATVGTTSQIRTRAASPPGAIEPAILDAQATSQTWTNYQDDEGL